MTNDRLVILETLLAIQKGEGFSSNIIRDVLDKYSYLDRQERSFIKRVCEGTLERKIELDFILNQFSNTRTAKMKPVIRTILEMSVYQLKYMDAVPASAVCNEAVKLAEKKGFGALKGFVNGVLRGISRNLNGIAYPDAAQDMCSYLSIRYSMPEWLTALFLKEQGERITERIFSSFMEPKPLTVRVNLSKTDVETLIQSIEKENTNIKAEQAPYLPYALYLTGTDSIAELPSFQKGYFQVQDVSSMLVCSLAGIKGGDYVLDVCAAPGGKALHAADRLKQLAKGGKVTAHDLTEQKLSLIKENCKRSGFDNIETSIQDATAFDETGFESADVLIADLPCSGFGIMGKKNDIKYRMTEEKLSSLVKLQRKILMNVSRYVKPGGTLMFSTCTIHRAENEENVAWITEHLPFETVSIAEELPQNLAAATADKGYVQLLPGVHETDGFFIARFKKVN